MNRLKQGMAAVGLVVSLGLVMPSSFGGSARADIPVDTDNPPNNPNGFETTLDCDLDRDGDNDVLYDVVTTSASRMWQDLHSSTVFVGAYSDQHRTYTPLPAPPDDPDAPVDTKDPFEADIPGSLTGHIGHKAQLVPCEETQIYEDFIGDGFPASEVVGAHYYVANDITWWVNISGKPDGSLKAASADGGGKHHKKGNHKGKKGKRGH